MATLAIVTCGPQLEVAFQGPDQEVPSLVRLAGVSPRSRLLLAAVDLLVEDGGVERSAIERVVVTRGPGSFTGIRAALASAAGLASAIGAEVIAYDSLMTQAARCGEAGTVWAAQPGRRGEVYARQFWVAPDRAPEGLGEIDLVSVSNATERGLWVAADALDLGGAERVVAVRSAAEALLALVGLGVPSQPVEPLYVEGPPIHQRVVDG
jgi:tRNA threonylcarbamoyl adenosine modification protein YeaZ